MKWHYKNKIGLKLIPTITTFISLPIATISCVNNARKNNDVFNKEIPLTLKFNKQYSFLNNSNQYKINDVKIDTFINPKNEDLYINVNEFIAKIDGITDRTLFKFKSKKQNKIYYANGEKEIIFDLDQNKILVNNLDVFQILKNSEVIDYAKRIEYKSTETTKLSDNEFSEFDLAKYNMSIEEKNNQIYIPFSIFNLLFLSQNYYNVYFNGEKFIGVSTVINKDIDANEYNLIMNNINNNKEQTKQFRLNNYNFMLFVFDNFYGLKNSFLAQNNAKSFDEYFEKTGLKEQFLSVNIDDNTAGYEKLFYENLNELHSSIQSGSYYHPQNYRANPYGSARSQKVNEYIGWLGILRKIRNASLANKENKFVIFHDDTAIIYLDEFIIGTNENLMSEESYQYDSFEKMYKAMELIKQNLTPIKKIILDLSLNGGGSIAAMEKVAGFLTNKDQQIYFYETISKLLSYSKYRVDVNKDNAYDTKDGYPDYQWYILTGINTFSAANLLTHIAKVNKLATIIGNKSGGGMYSILPLVLPDGTSLEISSNNAWVSGSNDQIKSESQLPYTQEGIEVDITIPYLAYMNYDIINAYLNDPVQGEKEYNKYLRTIKLSAWKNEKDNIDKYIKFINKKKRKQYENEINDNVIQEQDNLDTMEEKIENMKAIFRYVEHEYFKKYNNN
ncbi:S41 family peptidase [Mycoplasma sp. CSL7475-4]|uniref:S41 family peptidase n=1 Tax=Mycoplasma sp. CSL7475-4 TaxID=2973942 RepID=UPI00216AF0C2|nr:S41 family peptidase [Mycoplasma sp. CSL7475-4]MCS4536832.1 S41 family peptidase [Mycoplasma sp. CSL7475-4]